MTSLTFAGARQAETIARETAVQTRHEIEQRPGGLQAFREQLIFKSLVTPEEDQTLAVFYANGHVPHDTIATIAERVEPYHAILESGIPIVEDLADQEAFVSAVTEKNHNAGVSEALGPSRYFAVAVFDPAHPDRQIGSLGFQVFCHRQGPATIHTSYYVAAPEYRGLGLSQPLVDYVNRTAIHYIEHARPEALAEGKIYQFIESTPPKRTSTQNLLLDTAEAWISSPVEKCG